MKDLIFVTKHTFKDTFMALKRGGWIFIPIYLIVELLVSLIRIYLLPNSAILASILYYVIYLLQLTIYAKCLNEIVYTDRLKIQNMTTNLSSYFVNIMNTFFYIYLFKAVGNVFSYGSFAADHRTVISIIAIEFIIENILLSALFETIYIDHYGGLDAFKKAVVFLFKNLLPWIVLNLPYLAFLILNIIYDIKTIRTNPLLFILNIIIPPILLIFRGKLFMILSNSSKRKRAFMNEYSR